jgi:hypothetical protein
VNILFLYAMLAALHASPPPSATMPPQPSPRPDIAADPASPAPDPVFAEIERVGETATRVTLALGDDGRVLSCTVTEASASLTLDAEACRILSAGARFRSPGTNDPRTRSQRIVWRIEE